jgi:hypothetical protein
LGLHQRDPDISPMLEQKLHVYPIWRLFADVENKIGLGRHVLALVR